MKYGTKSESKFLDLDAIGDEGGTLGNVGLKLGDSRVEEGLLVVRDDGQRHNPRDTRRAKLDILGEVIEASLGSEGAGRLGIGQEVDICGLDQSSLATNGGLKDDVGETCTSVSHGEGSRSCTVLRFDNLVASVLNAVGQGVQLILGKGLAADL